VNQHGNLQKITQTKDKSKIKITSHMMKNLRIAVMLHSATFTGAPIAALRSTSLIKDQYNVDTWVPTTNTEFDNYCKELIGKPPLIGNLDLNNYDLFICHSGAMAPIVKQLVDQQRKVLWWIHEDTHFFDVTNNQIVNECFEKATGLIFTSPHCAFNTFAHWVWARKAYRVFVIPNFFPYSNQVNYANQSEKIRIVHIATLGFSKGSDRVVRLAKELPIEEFEFIFVGNVLNSDAKIFNDLPANISWVGQKSPEEIKNILCSAHIYLHPTRKDNQPLVILEAISCGAMVVTTDLPSLSSYLSEEDGLISYVNDDDQFHLLAKQKLKDIYASKKINKNNRQPPKLKHYQLESKNHCNLLNTAIQETVS
jgi:glycosyltransferase involved in cell wall biosynthesis